MTGRRSSTDTGIPLYLIPAVINRQIRMLGMRTYRISVKRTCRHHYNITIRTKSLHRELQILKSPASAPVSIGNNDSGFGGEYS